MNTIDVRELTPELLDDYLAFFDRDAFADNPEWDGCYCVFDHATDEPDDDDDEAKSLNRELAAALVRAGRIRGWLAYIDERPVGWVHATRRPELPHLHIDTPPPPAEVAPDRVGVITCFVVQHEARRQGVATALLDAALLGFRRDGLVFAEAYPAREPASDAKAFRGTVPLFEAAGFVQERPLERNVVVRRRL